MADQWTLLIPAPCEYLNANDRMHRMEEAAAIKAWRDASYTRAGKATLPKGLERVSIAARLFFETNRHRDRENYYATTKPIIDGLTAPKRAGQTGYGLIPDDTPEHLAPVSIVFQVGPMPRSATRFGLVQLLITDNHIEEGT